MYNGSASWLSDKDGVISIRIEQSICREFADVALNEMEMVISNEPLNELAKRATRDMNENLQEGIGLGAFCIKPLGQGTSVEYVMQGDFIPIRFDSSGRLMDVIFIEIRRQGDSDYYRRFERHAVSDGKLTVTNNSYKGSEAEIGNEISLEVFEDWAVLKNLEYDWDKPDFGYYRNPCKNTIDRTPNGISMFDSAIQLIKKADQQFGRLDWEYESAERSIIADVDAIPVANTEGYRTKPKERLVKTLDIADNTGSDKYHEFSPTLRDTGYIQGLNEYKRAIEENVGLAFGDLSNVQDVDKTATEVINSKKRKYNRVTAIQDNLKDCLTDLVDALAFYNGLASTGYEVAINFHDSILTDEEGDRDQLRRDLASGVLNAWEYRMKVYGEDMETAKANVPQAPGVLGDVVAMPMPGSAAAPAATASAEVQGKSLNGAQTQSLIAIMGQLSSGALTEGQAVNLISTAIGIGKDEARKILNGEL